MALADLTTVKKRVISVINASPGTYNAAVSGTVGAFAFQQEVEDAIFEAESIIVTQGYFQSMNSDLSFNFLTVSASLANGAKVPFHHGKISKVELSNGTTWSIGVEATHLDDITNALANAAYIAAPTFLYKLDDGQFYTTATAGRVTYPLYTRTAILQADMNETTLLIATAVKLLAKNSSPALFDYYSTISNAGIQQLIQDGIYVEQGGGQ